MLASSWPGDSWLELYVLQDAPGSLGVTRLPLIPSCGKVMSPLNVGGASRLLRLLLNSAARLLPAGWMAVSMAGLRGVVPLHCAGSSGAPWDTQNWFHTLTRPTEHTYLEVVSYLDPKEICAQGIRTRLDVAF